MVKVRNFFAKDEIFKQCWPPHAVLQRVLVVGNGYALIGGQVLACGVNPYPVKGTVAGVKAFLRLGSNLA